MFTNSGVGGMGSGLSAIDENAENYGYVVRSLIDDAQSFEEGTLSPDREENLEYFYGEIPAKEGEGTSTAVSTDFRDTVMAILPSLIRIFTSAEHVVNCQPNYEGQEDAAKQCTEYLQYVFWEDNPGFLILHDIMKDALRCKIGVVKWWSETSEEVTEQLYQHIDEEQLKMLSFENPTLEVVEQVPLDNMGGPSAGIPPPEGSLSPPPEPMPSPEGLPPEPGTEDINPLAAMAPPPGAMGGLPPEAGGMPPEMGGIIEGMPPPAPQMFKEVRVRFVKSAPRIKIESVPLDEFRIDRRAKNVESAILVGHDRITQVGELIAAGYSREELEPHLGATSTYSVDRQFRNEGIDEANVQDNLDIRYGCYYIRIDKDGDGIPELREIHTVGDNHDIIHDEMVQYVNYAVWCPDPEPHTLIGDTPAELVKDIQKIKTNMLRGALDSLAQSIWPRVVFNESIVNADDVLNDEIGAAIRTKGDPANTVMSLNHNFVGQPVFQMFEVMEVLRQQRTGINDASKGLDPKALQSTATSGVDTIISGAQERIELCARILAETGMKTLFQGLLRECVNSPNQERTIQLRGKWEKVNPSTFDPSMRISVNSTLGKGSDMTRLMVLQDIKQTQMLAMEKYGPDNPLCGPIEFRNTLTDMLAIGNVKNVDRYFKVITPEIVQAIASTPKEPDPALLLAQAEMEKTRAKVTEAIAKGEREDRQFRLDDDFRRDELMVTSILDAAKIEGELAYDVNEQQLFAAQTADEQNRQDAQMMLDAQTQGEDSARANVESVREGTRLDNETRGLGSEMQQAQHKQGLDVAQHSMAQKQQDIDAQAVRSK
jgi:hypothetical protein